LNTHIDIDLNILLLYIPIELVKMATLEKIIGLVSTLEKENERLDWDEYFLSICFLIASRSACHRLHVGSVIVKDNRILSAGYNGFLPGAPHISRVRDHHEMSTVHSEINAITDCAKRGVCLDDAKIYITHYPCINCFKAIVASGIKNIIYYSDYKNDNLVVEMALENNINIKKFESK
jgi:dCMP deaminase